jgi:hypothetical protein
MEDFFSLNKYIVDLSDYSTFYSYTYGYDWLSFEINTEITTSLENVGVEGTLNSPTLWNMIGTSLFNMPYMIVDGEYRFIIPMYSDSSSDDVIRQARIGDIIEALMSESDFGFSFSNKTKIILYNNKIAVEDIEDEYDVSINNVIFNVISIFLLQKLRTGQKNGN